MGIQKVEIYGMAGYDKAVIFQQYSGLRLIWIKQFDFNKWPIHIFNRAGIGNNSTHQLFDSTVGSAILDSVPRNPLYIEICFCL